MGAYHYSSVYGAQSTNDSSAKKIKNKKVFSPISAIYLLSITKVNCSVV